MNVLELSEQEIVRRNNLNELRALGIDPYPADEYPTDAFSTDIKAEYDDAAEEKRQVCIAGRIMSRRIMGKASFLSREIPVTGEVREVIDEPFTFNKKEYKATCLTVGNPHCIIFMDQVSQEKVRELGPYVENADEFPERVNLQICRQIDKGNLDIEIWERGSGYTKASGTGSCAAAIAAYRKGLMENRINVNQPGGMIQIDIKEDGTIFMTGTVGYIAEMSVAESFFS